jgi:hypothetical protein
LCGKEEKLVRDLKDLKKELKKLKRSGKFLTKITEIAP